jgi:DNA-directed RNA polymerase sigma subunit (sigma70/sigma32)
MWIRAYILIEIDNYSRIVKKPKAEIYKDREEFGSYKKEITLDIDAPVSTDTDTVFGDLIKIEDDTYSDLEVSEAYDTYKEALSKLLDGVKPRDRSIFLKKFGIGLPRPMLPKEIADQEGLSIARISQIFQTVVEQIYVNQAKYNIDPDMLFDVVKKFR